MEAPSARLEVGPVESARDAEARLRLASAHVFAVSDWLARKHMLDGGADNWPDLVDRLGHDVRALAQWIRMATVAHDE